MLTLLCLQTTGIAALLEDDLPRAAAIAPADPRVELEVARSLFEQRQGLTSAKSLSLALAAAPATPLSFEPVLLAGAAAASHGDRARAEALLLEARRRDPRSPLVRVHLLDLYAQSGRIGEAAVELAALSRLVPDGAGELFIPQLAYLAHIPGSVSQLARGLKPNPDVRQALLAHLARHGADPDLILEIAQQSKGAADEASEEAWQTPLVNQLVSVGAVERAYRLWQGFTSSSTSVSEDLVRDGSFRGSLRPAPFGWQLAQAAGGVAEPAEGRGLDVAYYGRDSAELARQLLVLAPGRYRLSVDWTGSGPSGSSALSWRVNCLGKGLELGILPIGQTSSASRQLASNFVVPPGCRGQWLVLSAQPLQLSRTERLKIHGLRIRRLS